MAAMAFYLETFNSSWHFVWRKFFEIKLSHRSVHIHENGIYCADPRLIAIESFRCCVCMMKKYIHQPL